SARVTANRVMVEGGEAVLKFQTTPPTSAPARIAVTRNGIARLQMGVLGSFTGTGAALATGAAIAGSSIKNRAMEMSAILRLRSFSRHRWMSVTIRAGTSAGSADQFGVVFMTAAIISVVSSPSNACAPVSIS